MLRKYRYVLLAALVLDTFAVVIVGGRLFGVW